MRNSSIKLVFTAIIFIGLSSSLIGADSLKYCISFNYYNDLSDTYDGGTLFSGDLKISKSWYGASITFGYFQSHSTFKYQVLIEEINRSIEIPFDEISIMKTGSLSLMMIPIQSKFINADFVFGVVLSRAKSFQFQDVEYSYSFQDNKFTYLYKIMSL